MIKQNGKDKFWLRIIIPIYLPKENPVVNALKEDVKAVLPDDVFLDVIHLEEGNHCIECRAELEENVPLVMKLIKNSPKQIDGIFVSDMDMCGVEPSREIVDIPIIGGFRPSAYTAMLLGQKFSIISITKNIMKYQLSHLRTFGIESNFASIIPTNIKVETLIESCSNQSKKEEVIKIVVDSIVQAVTNDSADAIIFGCSGFLGITDDVHNKLKAEHSIDIPVISPNRVAILYLYNLVRNNLSQSRQTYMKRIQEKPSVQKN